MKDIEKRALEIKRNKGLTQAIKKGSISQFVNISVSEAIVLGLLKQGITKYIGIFGHGTTHIGEVLRVYENAGIVKCYNVRHETEASHIAANLKWQYNESSVVFTSIGPGALQAMAGSLVAGSNSLGIYYLFGDETTHDEGYNMQQIPSSEQSSFLKVLSHMGNTYSLHTPEAVCTAMKRGLASTLNPIKPSPFYLLAPMNIQATMLTNFNLNELPTPQLTVNQGADALSLDRAVKEICQYQKITIKVGRGALEVRPETMKKFVEKLNAAFTHGPSAGGILPYSHKNNMGVGGSKGSISGNYAMENAELVIVIGARAVCQWDSSGTSWKKAKVIININSNYEDAVHYNRSIPLVGDSEAIVNQLVNLLDSINNTSSWIDDCSKYKEEWLRFKELRYSNPTLFDSKRGKKILTQPAAIKIVSDFSQKNGLCKIFDAGDVQANGFQIVEDEKTGMTITDTGSSYMGFAVSALVSEAIAEAGHYSVAFTGDGSFMMNPQVLIDAVQFGAKGMIALFDNRCMGAISSLQLAQYGVDFKTSDNVEVDYISLANSVKGINAIHSGEDCDSLENALKEAYKYDGLSLVYIPVYYGDNELGNLGAFGSWNVGNWCKDVQLEKHRLGF